MKWLAFLILTCSVYGQSVSFSKVYEAYSKDPGATMKKYRNKAQTYSATATSINRGDLGKYVISLDGVKGRVVIDKTDIPEDLNKLLWKQRNQKNSKLNIQFKGKWTSNRSKTLYFTAIEDISYSKPAAKKGKKKKK